MGPMRARAVAGSFYPNRPGELDNWLRQRLGTEFSSEGVIPTCSDASFVHVVDVGLTGQKASDM